MRERHWHNLSPDDWETVIRVDLDGAFYCARAVLPTMIAREDGPVPVSAEDRARMVQPEDCGGIITFLARLPAHVCINGLTVSPTWNRGYVAAAKALIRSG